MPRPADLPTVETAKHGTRSRYVLGCRCRSCKDANVAAYHAHEAKAKAAALELGPIETKPAPKMWTAPDGTKKVRIYKRACPGIHGKPCPHGTHLRKDSIGGICARCRKRLIWNGLVSAKAARHHLIILSNAGIGRKAVSAATDIRATTLQDIRSGKKKRIRATTERLILGVDKSVIADGARVDARPVWRMVRRLVRDHGYTQRQIAAHLGQRSGRLQIGRKRVTARTANKIAKLMRHADGDFLERRF